MRAFGSFAQEVMDAGVAAVLAMQYNVYVVTAAQFVGNLYASLAQGETFGAAASQGRKDLAVDPLRTLAYDPRPLQDWMVPVVYEAAPIRLLARLQRSSGGEIKLTVSQSEATPAQEQQVGVPHAPDVGFFGRDETLLALDRSFDMQRIVLLHAFAGSGKTSTAAEFARWYALTGGVKTNGVKGPILFTSFEQYRPLARVLDTIEQVFGAALERSGVHWLALSDQERRKKALEVLGQVPVLWIWDNVEPVAGFPAGTASAWSAAEQQELADFLRAARLTKAKFLLTSRRAEREWLGDLPVRIEVPPMPMQERVQMAQALAEKHGRRLTEVADWRPLLRFTQGNPLTITVLVGQALREGLVTSAQIEAFVERVRAGESAIEDEESQGRSKSLGASLSYGFAQAAFSEEERAQLALLHLFQGFVDVQVLQIMGNPETVWCLPQVRGLSREAGMALLDRAAEIGLLSSHRHGCYSIHPALPWYFQSLFAHCYPASADTAGAGGATPGSAEAATRAFVEAMGELGSFYIRRYEEGHRDVIDLLSAEEANLLQARQWARARGWWGSVIDTMQGLHSLYAHTGRRVEWAGLVQQIVPEFVDPLTDGPLPGREEQWTFVTEYRVLLAREARQWREAERLQRVGVDWDRQRAASALALAPEALDSTQRHTIRTLAVALQHLGDILHEQGNRDCVAAFQKAYDLFLRISDPPGAAATASNIGLAYLGVAAQRDLGQAGHWYQQSLQMHADHQYHGRAQCLAQLGRVAYEQFQEARAARQPQQVVLDYLNAALQYYQKALALLPGDAVDDLAVMHNQLGLIHRDAGDLEQALAHYRHSIRYGEAAGDLYGAAVTRCNVAAALGRAGRLPEALLYAQAALSNFQTFGESAADRIQRTQQLIALIQQDGQGQA